MPGAWNKNGISVFTLLSTALLGATLIPSLAFLLLWHFEYIGDSSKALGLAQIRDALDGTTQLLLLDSPEKGQAPDGAAVARLKRLLNGPVARIVIGPSTDSEASAALGQLLPVESLVFTGDALADGAGRSLGHRNTDGSWLLTDPEWVGKAALAWDGLDDRARRLLANEQVPVRVSRDTTKAIVRLGSTGYVWAITAAIDQNVSSYEYFHPQIEAVDVTNMRNTSGELVGVQISTLNGTLRAGATDEVVRYDYTWKNPEDSIERKKIVLMRYIEPWDLILCAGLYEDEYFLPAKAAETMLIVLVLFISSITLFFSFLFTSKIRKSLASLSDFSRLTSRAAGTIRALDSTGIRELDSLGTAMGEMQKHIILREKALKKELAEKGVLIDEVHHRVKNNLTVLASIINLQKDRGISEESGRVLTLLQGRINSMALVYQQLMDSGAYTELPFNDYIEGILSYHQSAQARTSLSITRKELLEPIVLKLETAMPLGLIVNELVSNTYEHGISIHRIPEITVEFRRSGDDHEFILTDNGAGLVADMQEGIGFLLVRALCSQLHATMAVMSPLDGAGGTTVTIIVPAS